MARLSTVVRHEYKTIIKQPSFWIALVAIPLLIGVVMALTFISGKTSSDKISELAKDLTEVEIIDDSQLINKQVIEAHDLTLRKSTDLALAKNDVKEGQAQALIVYPKNLKQDRTYQVYINGTDFTLTTGVTSLADSLLKTSLFMPLGSPEIISLAQTGAESSVTTYKDGVETGGINDYLVPGVFVVLFYIIFAFSIGHMLSSVSEEKENRSMEMVLTYVRPRTLIVGKLLAVSLVALTQVAFYALIGLIALLVMQQLGNAVSLPPGIDLNKLNFDIWPIFFGASYLVVGFLIFAGLMTATAAATPSAKEASSFSAVFFLGAFIPFYFIPIIATSPESLIVQILTYFPLTSPVVTLLRNTLDNMTPLESWLALVVMTGFMLLTLWAAVRAFRNGALEYGNSISLKKLLKR